MANNDRINLSQIAEAIEHAKAYGQIQQPSVLLRGFRFRKAADTSRNSGFYYVTYNDEYMGKFNRAGRFFPVQQMTQQTVYDSLELISLGSFAEQLAAEGIRTGICCCCGRTLTNADSIGLGIGPICREKWGFSLPAPVPAPAPVPSYTTVIESALLHDSFGGTNDPALVDLAKVQTRAVLDALAVAGYRITHNEKR